MENTTLIIDEKEREDAKALTQSFVHKDIRSRAYVNALGSEICIKYLKENNITNESTCNMHNIRKILEEFDISDIILSNIHIDVRVVYDENEIFIPKSHFDYNITPDIYVVLKISKDYSNTEFLGFFEPKMLNKNNMNSKYYFIEKEKLSSPVDLKNYIENFNGKTSTEYSEEELAAAEFLIISMADNNVNDEDKKKLLGYLKSSEFLRDRFVEFENFEMLAYQSINAVENYTADTVTQDPRIAALTADDIVEDPNDQFIDDIEDFSEQEPDIKENEDKKDNNGILGNLAEGAAIVGAEIAGTAIASAALAGAAESVEIGKDAAGMAVSAASALDAGAKIIDNLTPEESNNSLDISNDIDDFQSQEETLPEEAPTSLNEDENQVGDFLDDVAEFDETNNQNYDDNKQLEDIAEETPNFEDANNKEDNSDIYGSLDELFKDEDDSEENNFEINTNNEDDTVVFNNDEEPVYNETDNSGEIEFTYNDEYDDVVYENNDSYDDYGSSEPSSHDSAAPSNSSGGIPRISSVIHTPISEATDLVSMENIQAGNIEPEVLPKSDFDQMETMEMDEFKNLVDNYVPQEIKDESATCDIDSVEEVNKQLSEEHDSIPAFNENIADMVDIPRVEEHHQTEEDVYDENLPQMDEIESPENNLSMQQDDTSSDDFVQEMPEEIKSAEPVMLEDEEPLEDMDNLGEDDNTNNSIDNQYEETNETTEEFENKDEVLANNDNENFSNSEENDEIDTSVDNKYEEINETAEGIEIEDENLTIPDSDSFTNFEEEEGSLALDDIEDITLQTEATEEMPDIQFPDEFAEENATVETEKDETKTGEEVLAATESLIGNKTAGMQDEDIVKTVDMYEENKIEDNLEGIINEENIDEVSIDEFTGEENNNPENESLGVLYRNNEVQDIQDSEVVQDENYDFRPKSNSKKLIPVFAVLAAVIIAGSIVGIFMKNRNSIDSETLIQSSPENALISPETDNSDILLNDIEPAIPTDAADMSPSAPAISDQADEVKDAKPTKTEETKPETQKVEAPAKPVVTPAAEAPKKPLNANKTITLKKLSWEVPDYLSYSDNIRRYLQSAGKSIRLTLSSDLLLTNDYIYSNQVKVNIKLSNEGAVKSASIGKSSGSTQVDNIVLQTVKETLNVVKPPRGEVPTPEYNLGLIIYL